MIEHLGFVLAQGTGKSKRVVDDIDPVFCCACQDCGIDRRQKPAAQHVASSWFASATKNSMIVDENYILQRQTPSRNHVMKGNKRDDATMNDIGNI